MKVFFCTLILLLGHTRSFPQHIKVAAAANLQFVIKHLQRDFTRRTGIKLDVIVGSSGRISAQIRNGAPYDLFLSADTDFPRLLHQAGFAIEEPVVYALGSLIVCSTENIDINRWQEILRQEAGGKISIANPRLAPYGKAAEKALQSYGLWQSVKARLVFGESISQVNTYILKGATSIGFTTEALLYENNNNKKLRWLRIPQQRYGKIEQSMVILKYSRGGNLIQARKFFKYLQSSPAKAIFKQNGYDVP